MSKQEDMVSRTQMMCGVWCAMQVSSWSFDATGCARCRPRISPPMGADTRLGERCRRAVGCMFLAGVWHEAKCPVEYGSQEIRYLTVQHAGDVHAAARENACAKGTLGIYF
jgi:hypothetical protein